MKKAFYFGIIAAAIFLILFFVFSTRSQAATVCQIANGCTATGTPPTYGQVLIGGKNGEYEYVATSTFGTAAPVTSVFGRLGAITAQNGDYTTDLVPEGSNLYYTLSRWAAALAGTTTDALAEGMNNLYFTNARSDARFVTDLAATTSVKSIVTLSSLSLPYSQITSTPDLTQYLTLSAWFGTTTDQLREGTTNLYFTNARSDARFVTDLAATTSVKSISTLPSLSLPWTQVTGAPAFLTAAITDLGLGFGGTTTGPKVTLATSSDTNLQLNITNNGTAFNFAPTWAGTLAVSRGGTGHGSFTAGQLIYGGNPLNSVATSSASCSGSITCSGFTVVGSVSPAITLTNNILGGTYTLGNLWFDGTNITSTSSVFTVGSIIGTTTATSTFAGGFSINGGGFTIATILNCNSTNALTTDASGHVVCGSIGGGQTPWTSNIDAAFFNIKNIGIATTTKLYATSSVAIGTSSSPEILTLDNTANSNFTTAQLTNHGVTGILDADSVDTFNGQSGLVGFGSKTNAVTALLQGNHVACGIYDDNTFDTLFDCYPPANGKEMTYTNSLVQTNGTVFTDRYLMNYGDATGLQAGLIIASTLYAQPLPMRVDGWWEQQNGNTSEATSSWNYFLAQAVATGTAPTTTVVAIGDVGTTSASRGDGVDPAGATLQFMSNSARSVAAAFSKSTNHVLSRLFTILNNGNVGVGTTTPNDAFDVAGNAYIGGNLTATGTLLVGAGTPQWTLEASTTQSNALTFTSSGLTTPNVVFQTTGNVGIGTSTPNATLDLNGGEDIENGNCLQFRGTTYSNFSTICYNNSSGHVSTTHGFFFDNGGIVTGTSYGVSTNAPSGGALFAGSVGIGTSSPYVKLGVGGTVAAANYVATTTATSTFAGGLNISAGGLTVAGIGGALALTDSSGDFQAYGGAAACSGNNFVTTISATGGTSCGTSTISGISLGGTLGALSHDTTLTGTSYTGTSAVSNWGIDLTHANTWTGNQTINATLSVSSTTPASPLTVAGNVFLDSNVLNFASSSATTLNLNYLASATTTIVTGKANAFSFATSTTNTPLVSMSTAAGTNWGNFTIGPFSTTTPTPFAVSDNRPTSGTSGLLAYFGDSDMSLTNPVTYSYKSGSGGSLAVLGFNAYINAAGSSKVINTNYNGWEWSTDGRGLNGDNSPMSFSAIDRSGTGHTYLTINGSGSSSGGGHVGIGTTSPYAPLSVQGQIVSSYVTATSSTASTFNGGIGVASTSPWRTFSVSGTMALTGETSSTAGNAVCVLATTGDVVTAGNTTCTTSSKFTKQNILPLGLDALAETMKLNPVRFAYIDTPNVTHYGLIAEDVQKVDPNLVEHATASTTIDGHTFKIGDPIALDTDHLSAGLLVADIQELQKEIDAVDAGVITVKRSAEENWQDGFIALLLGYAIYNEWSKRRRK